MHFKRDAIIFFAATLLVLQSTSAVPHEDSTLVSAASAPSAAANVQGGLVPTPQPTLHEAQSPEAQATQGLLPQADAGANPEWNDEGDMLGPKGWKRQLLPLKPCTTMSGLDDVESK
ncbi:hypothetical protein BGZ68_001821 [Mortierella alpina]|nr:hypothetical protein BGZ68_001821 [Mortierella alpina]